MNEKHLVTKVADTAAEGYLLVHLLGWCFTNRIGFCLLQWCLGCAFFFIPVGFIASFIDPAYAHVDVTWGVIAALSALTFVPLALSTTSKTAVERSNKQLMEDFHNRTGVWSATNCPRQYHDHELPGFDYSTKTIQY